MATGAMVLGIIGGFVGLTGAFMVGSTIGMAESLGANTGMSFQAILGILLALLGLIGGAMAKGKPKAAGVMMLISGIGGFFALSGGWFFAAVPLCIGGILGVMEKERA